MTDRGALRRAELALAAPVVTAALLVLVAAVDLVRFHGLTLDVHVIAGLLAVIVLGRWSVSVARQLRAQRAFLRRLPVIGETVVHGHRVWILRGAELVAFCAGLVRPAVYVSEGTLAAGTPELRAILAHEAHHRHRRDPLRLLLARAAAAALGPLPPFASLPEHQPAIADLAADAATVAALGDRAPLAAALVRFDAVAPERVDGLLGTLRAPAISPAVLAVAGAVLAAIAMLVVTMVLAGWHPHPLALVAAVLPACLAARRAALRPA